MGVVKETEDEYRGWFTVEQAWKIVQEKGGMAATRTYMCYGDGWFITYDITISFD